MRKLLIFIVVLAGLWGGWYFLTNNGTSRGNSPRTDQTFDKTRHSLDDPASIWVVVNKRRPLGPQSYAPSDLVAPDIPLRLAAGDEEMLMRKQAAEALKTMYAAAKQQGLELMVSSAYRSYGYQQGLYNRYVSQQGRAVADTQSARPGFSEHQTGWAVDIEPASRECEVEECFGDLPEGKWITDNAYRYGFIIRYPKDKQSVTGYIYEPWHLRYVGTDLASELHRKRYPTLEAFFGTGNAPDY